VLTFLSSSGNIGISGPANGSHSSGSTDSVSIESSSESFVFLGAASSITREGEAAERLADGSGPVSIASEGFGLAMSGLPSVIILVLGSPLLPATVDLAPVLPLMAEPALPMVAAAAAAREDAAVAAAYDGAGGGAGAGSFVCLDRRGAMACGFKVLTLIETVVTSGISEEALTVIEVSGLRIVKV